MLSPEQFATLRKDMRDGLEKQLPGAVESATMDYLDKHGDALLDRGADDAGLATEVTANESSMNTFTIACPSSTATTLYADLLFWGDLVPYGYSSESASYVGAYIGPVAGTNVAGTYTGASNATAATYAGVVTITPAEFAAAGFGWQPPAWINAPLGISSQTGFTLGQTYQLSLLFMYQSVCVFSNLNITSSENSQQAPVLGSLQFAAKHINAWGALSQNGSPLSDAIQAVQYRQNQCIVDLGNVITLFDYLNVTTQNVAGTSTAVTFQAIFHAVHKKATGKTFQAAAQAANKKLGKPPVAPRNRMLAG